MGISLGTSTANNGIAFGLAAPTGGIPAGMQSAPGGGSSASAGGSSKTIYTTNALQVYYSSIKESVKYYKGEYNDSI